MNLQRKLTLMVTTAGIAFGAGHFVQKRAEVRQTVDVQPVKITSLAPVAAGPEALARPLTTFAPPLPAEAAPIDTSIASKPEAAMPPAPVLDPQTTLAAADPQTLPLASTPIAPPATSLPDVAAVVPAAPVVEITEPAAKPATPSSTELVTACDVEFDLVAQPGAMIGLTVLAPCNAGERVVLWHEGLAVTAKMSSTGSLFTSLPALKENAKVEVRFQNGDRISQAIALPEAKGVKRFAVQWQDADAFQLHAFEDGAGYNLPGHYSAAYTGSAGYGPFVSILGDANTDLPLLAEVFTFSGTKPVEVVVEASVTDGTCGRTIFGEMIASEDGIVDIQDLTLAMPECDGLGDILVLKNLMQDMKLAAAD